MFILGDIESVYFGEIGSVYFRDIGSVYLFGGGGGYWECLFIGEGILGVFIYSKRA